MNIMSRIILFIDNVIIASGLMFCSCTHNHAFEILMQETPTKTWTEKIIKAQRLGELVAILYPLLAMSLWVFFYYLF